MDLQLGGIAIIGVCAVVLLLASLGKFREWLFQFVFRAVTGTLIIFFLNGFLVSQGISIAIGINPITIITSGVLGFPGLIMLYGINLYHFL